MLSITPFIDAENFQSFGGSRRPESIETPELPEFVVVPLLLLLPAARKADS